MPAPLDSIGFDPDDDDAMQRHVRRALAEGDQIEVIGVEPGWGGRYVGWDAGDGAQLWLGVDEEGQVTRVAPHFAGRGRAHVSLERSYDHDGTAPPAGGVFCYVAPGTGEETKAGLELPIYARFYDMACDYEGYGLVQVAALCRGADVYADAEAYFEAMDRLRPGVSFAVESFLPVGLLEPDGGLPPAAATLSGRVLEARRIENPAGGRAFWWALVKTVGMTVDLVAGDGQIAGEPRPGAIVSGSFELSALPADGPRRADVAPINAAPADVPAAPQITITRIGDE